MSEDWPVMCNELKNIYETASHGNVWDIVTAIATCVAAAIAWWQLRRINATDSSRFLLELRESFSEKRRWKVHRAIKNKDYGYLENHDVEVDDYLGLFEVCEKMIEKRTVTTNDFSNFYLYRLEYILENAFILKKFLNEKVSYWTSFSKLLKRFPELKEEYYKTPEQILLWEKIENE